MSELIKVGMADYKIGKAPESLITLGLGSCVGITLYDKARKIGAMAHIMLPKNNSPETKSLKYADDAIEQIEIEINKLGLNISNFEAKIAGGSQMFSFSSSDEKKSVGYRNVLYVKELLKEYHINMVAEDTGGNFGRTIELNLETGELRVKTIGHGEKII